MSTVTGNLITISEDEATGASVDIQLCGFGSRVPYSEGTGGAAGIVADAAAKNITPTGTGNSFQIELPGNDIIDPPGSYYTVTFRNANGDILQVNAYVFEDTKEYDLGNTPPYNPIYPPPPVKPPVTNLLDSLAAADAMIFDGSEWTAFKTTLNKDVTQPTFVNMIPGNLYTFIVVQDGTGNHKFNWAGNVRNATPIDFRSNSTTVQTFVADEFGDLLAISAGTYQ
jgi:hypothetical protein